MSLLWHMLLVPLSTCNHNVTCLFTAAICPRKLNRVSRMVCPAALNEWKEEQIGCMCPARAMRTQCQLFIQRWDAPAHAHQCTEFGVASSKTHKSRGSHVCKVPLLWYVRLAPFSICDPKIMYPRLVATYLPSLVHMRLFVWRTTSSNSSMLWIRCKDLHVQLHVQ